MTALDTSSLTDRQFLLAHDARVHPVILAAAGEKNSARALERGGWGTVEAGASGEIIFRLSQVGCDAFAEIDELRWL